MPTSKMNVQVFFGLNNGSYGTTSPHTFIVYGLTTIVNPPQQKTSKLIDELAIY
jgi:hypothetical protein